MTDDIDREEEQALTAEYVLGLLSAEEEAAFEEVLAVDPELRAEYAFWADRIAALTDDLPQETPPERVLEAIRAELFGAAHRPARAGWLQRLGLLPAVVGGLVAALAVLWVINLYVPSAREGVVPPAQVLQAQIAAEDDSLIVNAAFDAGANVLALDRAAGEAAPPDRAREVWLIAGDTPPVSLGLLSDDSRTTLALSPELAAVLPGATLAISDEPAGGSPTGSPTGAVLAVGQVTTTG